MNYILPLNDHDFTVILMNLYQLPPNNFCSTYLTSVQKLAADISSSQNLQQKRKIFENFTNKFTAVPDIWLAWKTIEKQSINNIEAFIQNKDIFEKLKTKAMKDFQFGYDFDIDILEQITFNIYTTIFHEFTENAHFGILKNVKELNNFVENRQHYLAKGTINPNNFDDFWNKCDEYSTMEISKTTKRKVEESILIEECLKGIMDDEIKKIEILIKNANKECVIEFIERRIFKDSYNLNFWNLYISYLEEKQDLDVLNVYSRYCRLFVDDEIMTYKYYDAIKMFHQSGKNVSKWLLDVVKLDADFVSIDSSKNLMVDILEEFFNFKVSFDSNSSYGDILTFFKQKIKYEELDSLENSDISYTVLYQDFAFPGTMIHHILATSNSSVLHKLHKTCKYFYKKFKVTVIHKLELTSIAQNFMYQNSAFINKQKLQQFKIDKIWLSNSFTINSIPGGYDSLNLSKTLFPKFHKCDIRFLSLTGQKLTEAEFEYLTKSNSVESLCLEFTIIQDSDGNSLNLEKIIQQIPNGHTFILTFVPYSNETATVLSSLNHQTKIILFDYKFAPDTFNIDEFSNFVKKTGTVSSKFTIQIFGNHQFRTAKYRWISLEVNPIITMI